MLYTSKNLSSLLSNIGKPIDYVKTGFFDLDSLIGGLQLGEMMVVAARPGMGKTSFVIDLTRTISNDTPVMFLSLEMSGNDLLERLMSSVSLVPQERLHATDLSKEEIDKIALTTDHINQLDLYIRDDSALTPDRFNSYLAEFYKKMNKPFVVIVDYLQMMRGDKVNYQRSYELQDILDSMAAELKKYPMRLILVSQLNREADKRENHWPKLSDLKDSGYVEQVADKIIFLHRPDYFAVSDGDFTTTDTGETFIIVAKNRRGRYGFVRVAFIPEIFSFRTIGKDDKIQLFDPSEIPF